MAAKASDNRVLLLAPTTRDGEASQSLLASAGVQCVLMHSIEELCAAVELGTAAVIVPEESIAGEIPQCFMRMIKRQPVWSDLPVIILSRTGAESPAVALAISSLGNVSLVERPVRISTLLSMVKSAIRARERQYQVRNHLAERKQAEQALQVARESAEAANRAKDQFLAVLSHELRTPLSPVLMCITAMEKDPTLAAPLHADVEMMRRNIELESRLIDDLLDLSRVTTGKLRLRIDHIALHEVLKYVFQVCESDLLAKELHLVRELDAADDQVMGDSARLQQVFWNLLKNAIKFSPRGQQILVRTSTPSPGRLKVEVRDYGVGIPADVLPRLFNAFEQGNPAVTHQFGGLGLGLAISKAVVDLHGGSIEATSQGRGYGATFSVELLAAEPGHDHRHGNGQFKSDANRQSLRVLFVEDHPDTANVMTRLLSSLGYQVRTANSVAAALQCAAAEKFDILVSDIGLPDASGYELMEQIRDRYRMKGIALSGYGMEGDVQRGKAAGFADHITKPVSVAQLQAAIQRVVRSGDSD